MNRVIQDDLYQEFNISSGTVVETRKVAGSTTDEYPIPNPQRVYFAGMPDSSQILGTKRQTAPPVGEVTKESRKYNRSIVVALGSTGTDEHAGVDTRGNFSIYYNVWVPDGEDANKVGKTWLGWKPFGTASWDGSVTVEPITVGGQWGLDRLIQATCTFLATQAYHTWIGVWNPKRGDSHPEDIKWTGPL